MLKEAVSSLAWLVGGRRPLDDSQAAEANRRIWVRYPCNVEAVCKPANAVESQRRAARVRNISRGGINLVVDQCIPTGTLLSVELPVGAEICSSRVLAYVVRANAWAGGDWSLGCSFALELAAEDLEPLGAKKALSPAKDVRAWQRFPSRLQATYQLVRDPSPECWPAEVLDLSPVGIGLRVSQEIEIGRLLSLELLGAEKESLLTILTSVARITAQGDGQWLLGCTFIRELLDLELRRLV